MKRWLYMALWLPVAVAAQSPAEPMLRVQLDKTTVAPGETIQLRITLLGPTWFPKPPEYPGFEIPNLIVRLPEGASYPVSERVGRDTWSGIVREYSLQPMVAGNFRIPAKSISVTYADPETSKPVTRQLKADEILFASRIPSGAEGLRPFIAAHSLTLEQNLDGETLEMQPGDAFKRTITARVTGAAPVFVPPLIQPLEADHVSAYPDEPRVGETLRDDEPVGERIEQITYIATSGGSVSVPAIELRWWNLETRQIETARVDGFDITARRSLADILRELDWFLVALCALAVAILVMILARLRPRLRAWQQQRREAYLASEAYAFTRAQAALRARNLGAAISATDTWSSRIPRACSTQLADISSALAQLGAVLYGRNRQRPSAQQWSAASNALRSARQAYRAVVSASRRGQGLPDLNPRVIEKIRIHQ